MKSGEAAERHSWVSQGLLSWRWRHPPHPHPLGRRISEARFRGSRGRHGRERDGVALGASWTSTRPGSGELRAPPFFPLNLCTHGICYDPTPNNILSSLPTSVAFPLPCFLTRFNDQGDRDVYRIQQLSVLRQGKAEVRSALAADPTHSATNTRTKRTSSYLVEIIHKTMSFIAPVTIAHLNPRPRCA